MSEAKKIPKRDEVAIEQTWDLTKIFIDDDACLKALEEAQQLSAKSVDYKGTLAQGASSLLAAIEYVLDLYRQVEKVYVYSHLKNDQDTSNGTYQSLNARASSLASQAGEATAWLEPELLTLSEEKLSAYFAEEERLAVYQHYIEQITAQREHVLSEREEALLASASEVLSSSSDTFNVLNNADLVFPTIKDENGQSVQLSHGLYGQLLESNHRSVCEAAFKAFYQIYQQFTHTFSSTLSANIKKHNFYAKTRGYQSAREAALSANQIPESVYDTLIDVVHRHLPSLHRYVALRKKLMNVETLHMYDMYAPLLGEAPIKYTYEEAKEKTLAALAPLGEDYLAIIQEAFDQRWIDVVESAGKRSGAYSSGCYDTSPYILLNWHDSLDHLYTLVHELGHSAHSYLTRSHQPYVYGDYSIFLAEIASTTNENLLTEYLLQTETDPKMRAFILNRFLDGFKGTIFRQTQFAEFENWMHVEDAKGMPLTSDYLSQAYSELNQTYYGPDVAKDPEIAYEWSRIPHFYYNYYVYQYSTGFSAASTLAANILAEKPDALSNYLTYLKAGCSAYPIDVMQRAGVDMTQPDYIESAMKIFEQRLDELEKLVATLS